MASTRVLRDKSKVVREKSNQVRQRASQTRKMSRELRSMADSAVHASHQLIVPASTKKQQRVPDHEEP